MKELDVGIEIKLTDKELPISPPLIDFLHRHISGGNYGSGWHDQLQENLSNDAAETLAVAERHIAEVLRHPLAVQAINRSYQLLLSIMFGGMATLRELQDRYRFIVVVGYPRSGGSYLTKHLFQAIGLDAAKTPRVIAHDGFPDPQPFSLEAQNNGYITMMRHMAEYLAMVEVFFSGRQPVHGRIIVPKKTYQAGYYGAFFNRGRTRNILLPCGTRFPPASQPTKSRADCRRTENSPFAVTSKASSAGTWHLRAGTRQRRVTETILMFF